LIYVKFTFYSNSKSTLVQQVGVRLMLTGLLFASLAGLADILGFGSHLRTNVTDIFFGGLQGIGLIASLTISSIGVLIYTVAGNPQITEESMLDDLATNYPRDLQRITGEIPAITADDLDIEPDETTANTDETSDTVQSEDPLAKPT